MIELLRLAGERAQLEQLATDLHRSSNEYPPLVHARLALARGDLASAAPHIRKGLAEQALWVVELAREPPYRILRELPGVAAFVRKIEDASESSTALRR